MVHTPLHQLAVFFRALVKGITLVILWTTIFILGLFFYSQFDSPVNLVLGLPLALLGATLTLSSLYEMAAGMISLKWGRRHCPFCPHEELLENETPVV